VLSHLVLNKNESNLDWWFTYTCCKTSVLMDSCYTTKTPSKLISYNLRDMAQFELWCSSLEYLSGFHAIKEADGEMHFKVTCCKPSLDDAAQNGSQALQPAGEEKTQKNIPSAIMNDPEVPAGTTLINFKGRLLA
jgi:hypothetical protein